jgi:hypothetical protein
MIPLLVLVLAIGTGARIFAGEEDAGRLELVLAYPLRRSRAVLADAAAVIAEVVAVCVAAGIAIAVSDPVFGLDLSFGRVVEAVCGVALLGVFYGVLALSVGAASGNKALAVAASVGYAAVAYLISGPTRSPAGSIRSDSSRRSGGSGPRRSRTGSAAAGSWCCSERRRLPWSPGRFWSGAGTSRCRDALIRTPETPVQHRNRTLT